MRHMIGHEAGDEVVGMIVAVLHPQGHGLVDFLAGRFEQMRAQLFFQELVGAPLVDQDVPGEEMTGPDQFGGVVFFPNVGVVAQISGKGLVPQGTRDGATIGAKADSDL